MWIIRWFLIAFGVVLVSFFIGRNMKLEPISIDYIFGETDEMSPLMVMFFAYVAGFISWFVISLFNFFKMRSELAAKDKLIKNLKQELNSYRNQSLNFNEESEKTVVLNSLPEKNTSPNPLVEEVATPDRN